MRNQSYRKASKHTMGSKNEHVPIDFSFHTSLAYIKKVFLWMMEMILSAYLKH